MDADIPAGTAVVGPRSPRWAFMRRLSIPSKIHPGEVYLDRLRVIETPLFGVYVHWIHEPDSDRDPHDHPWTFWSIILRGEYTERVWDRPHLGTAEYKGYRRRWLQGTIHKMTQEKAHQIEEASSGLVTLIIRGRRKRTWGFWDSAGDFKTWLEYEDTVV